MHVIVNSETNHLDNHLSEESPSKEIIKNQQNFLFGKGLGVVIHSKANCVGQNEYKHNKIVKGVIDKIISLLVEPILLGSVSSSHFILILVFVLLIGVVVISGLLATRESLHLAVLPGIKFLTQVVLTDVYILSLGLLRGCKLSILSDISNFLINLSIIGNLGFFVRNNEVVLVFRRHTGLSLTVLSVGVLFL
jgi:hypothetical protein